MSTHPDVGIIWNIWPLSMFVWTVFRVPLNIFFGIFYVPLAWTWWLWNLFWESILELGVLPIFMSLLGLINIGLTFLSVFIIPIPFAMVGWLIFATIFIGFWQFFTIPT